MRKDLSDRMSSQKSKKSIYSDKILSTQNNLQSDINQFEYHLNFPSENISHHGHQIHDKNEGRNEYLDISELLNLSNDDNLQGFAPQSLKDHQDSPNMNINFFNNSTSMVQENKLYTPETEPNQEHNYHSTTQDPNCKNFWANLLKKIAKIFKKNTVKDPQECICLIQDPKIRQLLQKLKENTKNTKIKKIFENTITTGTRNELLYFIDNIQEMRIIMLELLYNKKYLKCQQLLGRMKGKSKKNFYKKLNNLKKLVIKRLQKLE